MAKAAKSGQESAPFHFQWKWTILQLKFYLVFSNDNFK